MSFSRRCGILLHPTSLPSSYGIGDLGKEAYRFVDFLKNSNQSYWQILPLGTVGFGESPYQSFSAFAGNPLIISIDKLIEKGYLSKSDVQGTPKFDKDKVQFNTVKVYKEKLLRNAFKSFINNIPDDYSDFCKKNSIWLDDFGFFMAIKDYYKGIAWYEWDEKIAKRDEAEIKKYLKLLDEDVEYHKFLQYVFFNQWYELKKYANTFGISIIGDIPLFISNDSSDAWVHPELFHIDKNGFALKIAGVPPDYFSETGQFWGNPHYRWDVMEKNDYKWWRERFEATYELVDIIRIDHFRGFESYWEIPGSDTTAVNGKWVKGPGSKFFKILKQYLGDVSIIAEDLGFITEEVNNLKNEFGFPGMKILHFTFGAGSEERFLPHNYEENSVVYTGTHDNDTTIGWYTKLSKTDPDSVSKMKDYLGIEEDISGEEFCWLLIEVAYKSKSNTTIIPMQDILCLGTEARMNIPSTIGNNWVWRYRNEMLTDKLSERLSNLTVKYNRF